MDKRLALIKLYLRVKRSPVFRSGQARLLSVIETQSTSQLIPFQRRTPLRRRVPCFLTERRTGFFTGNDKLLCPKSCPFHSRLVCLPHRNALPPPAAAGIVRPPAPSQSVRGSFTPDLTIRYSSASIGITA